ncbi:MAG: ABC transporter ATP-binding protein [Candidatus Shapirobacteria bacterium]
MIESIVQIKNIFKTFRVGTQDVPVLKDISFNVKKGDFLVIYGPSGCGKSTLLHTILGLEAPTKGTIIFLGKDLYKDSYGEDRIEDDRTDFRKNHIGMVYQQANWIKSLTVLENIIFPLSLLGMDKLKREEMAKNALKTMEMLAWANYSPSELSSGQQQKVALARALVTNPEVIIADEPTGNLDFESGQELMSLLTDLSNNEGKTIIMVTHDLEYLKYAKSTVRMLNGQVVELNTSQETIKKIKCKKVDQNEK